MEICVRNLRELTIILKTVVLERFQVERIDAFSGGQI
jgi:hypothetical protein